MRNLKVIVVVLVAQVIGNVKVYGFDLMSFKDLCDRSNGTRLISMEVGQNLKFQDPNTLEISSVGLDGTTWHIGFRDESGYFVGWANNPFAGWPDWEGWIDGQYMGDLIYFDSDGKPNSIIIVNDLGDEGMGTLEWSGATGWVWHLDPADAIYETEDVLFGPDRIRGDISQLPSINRPNPGTLILPEMIISPLPPEIIGFDELINLADWWLSDFCSPDNGGCNGADNDLDGVVNMVDFSRIANYWMSPSPF